MSKPSCLIIGLLLAFGVLRADYLTSCNIRWDAPGVDYHDSMPIGNGDIGLNVWTEENGDICFFIGKTDAWSENGRLLKVGKIRIKTDPPLFSPGDEFEQTLDLKTATIRMETRGKRKGGALSVRLEIWVDANNPVVHVRQRSSMPMRMTALIEPWRNERQALPSLEVSDLLEDRSKPGNLHQPVFVEPDQLIRNAGEYIGWYHYNDKSVGFEVTNTLQGLDDYFQSDPLLHRIFGALVAGDGAKRLDDKTLQTGAAKTNLVSVYVLTQHPSTPEEWLKRVVDLARTDHGMVEQRYAAHKQWWADFWNRSWLHTSSDRVASPGEVDDAFIVTRAYTLQRFIDAAAGRGRCPIKFNGSIFTVPAEGKPGYADYRRWGPGYWWQNTRLPYLSMFASGDFDLLQPFFKMYADDIFKVSQFRTKKYFGIDGVYYPECMYFWGSVFTATYGWTPWEEREDRLQESGWHKWEWVASPELAFMMLDYYDYTMDRTFLAEKIIPVANAVLKFFDGYYKTDENGQLVMHPAMACETWWNCVNPMPELAGLHAVTKRLLALPPGLVKEKDRQFWASLQRKLPPLPLRETPSGKALAPAEQFADKRNVENPELYAVFPFRLIAVGNNHLQWGVNALRHRWDKGDFGWRQDDIFMAYLGLADSAKKNLVNRAKNFDKGSRFPAFWGPNYDWVPDQDHGGVLMKAFQSMLLQTDPYSDRIYLLPAWPKEWDCDFKLHAPYNTVVQGRVKNGHVVDLVVTPQSRMKDIVFCAP